MENKENNAAILDQQSTESTELPVATPENIDTRQGFPQPSAEEVPGPIVPDAVTAPETVPEGQTPESGTETPPKEEPASEPTTERLKQQLARANKLIAATGINPLSDISEQFEKGEVTAEMIQDYVASKRTPAVPTPGQGEKGIQPQSDVEAAMAELAEAEKKYNEEAASGEGVSIKTNDARYTANQRLSDAKLEAVTNQIAAEKKTQQVNESLGAVLNIARTTEGFAEMEQPLQSAVEQVSIGVTTFLADQKARAQGYNPENLTPAQFQGYANDANELLGTLAEHYRELGRAEIRATIKQPQTPVTPDTNKFSTPTPVINAPVNPVGNVGTEIPPANPYAKVNHQNHADAAKDFVSKSGGR